FCEMEQFASPLGDLDTATQGYISSVFLTKIKISGKSGPVDFNIGYNSESNERQMELKEFDGGWIIVEKATDKILLMIEPGKGLSVRVIEAKPGNEGQEIILQATGRLKASQNIEILVKLPSPTLVAGQLSQLKALDYAVARNNVIDYWEKWIGEGAQFEVPEQAVNDLFRANLWHALILPRHTLGQNGESHMDLPYANTAYGQQNSDWPVNQAVYVDYMIYG